MHALLFVCLTGLLVAARPAAGYRHLLEPATDADGFFVNGRATWFEHPHTGSCGYGQLDGYAFGRDAVAAMPDVNPDYKRGACGRCYELKCRGIQARSADGSVDLDRSDACHDTTTRIVVKIVDTCPCQGNEKWCCGDAGLVHFDLSDGAFRRLAPQGRGIIGLAWRPVPCEAANGTAAPRDWQALEQAVAQGASPDVFVGGELGVGWKKTVHGDDLRAMYTYNNSLATVDGERALCTTVSRYGGFDFSTQAVSTSIFEGAEAVEFWVRGGTGGGQGLPDLVFRLGNAIGRSCTEEHTVQSHATQDAEAGWTRAYFPLADFACVNKGDYGATPDMLNRLQWENKNPGKQSVCVRDVRIIPKGASAAAPKVQASSGPGGRR